MGGNQDGCTIPVGGFFENIPELADSRGIQAVGRLIQDQQLRTVEKSLGNAQTLTHSQRIAAYLLMDAVFQSHQMHHFFHALL